MVDYYPFEKTTTTYSIFSTSNEKARSFESKARATRSRPLNEKASSHEAAHLADQSTTMSGMTQEMEALGFEGDEGVELTDEEAEASAREYDAAQVPAN